MSSVTGMCVDKKNATVNSKELRTNLRVWPDVR